MGNGRFQDANVTVTVHHPARPNGAAIVICPGGGYGGLVMGAEGHGIAAWLNRYGIIGVVLEYRFPKGNPAVPLLDAQRAIRTVRANAKAWGCDSGKIGIMGFSAGGHLAATAGTHFDAGNADAADPIDRVSCRPDFLLLIYPVISMGEKGHAGSRTNLLGPDPSAEQIKLFSNELQVTAQTPPAFLAHAKDDDPVPPENSRMFHAALKANRVPTEYLELPRGGHGLNGYQGPMWTAWQEQSLHWLGTLGIEGPCPRRGPNAGRTLTSECFIMEDAETGSRVTRLTTHRCHSNHLYFTNPGWWDKDRRLLFASERHNQPNLFSVEFATQAITQITDLGLEPELPAGPRMPIPWNVAIGAGCRHPIDDLFFFVARNAVWSVHLQTHELNRLWECPAGWQCGIVNVTCDGRYLCTSVLQKLRDVWPDWCDGHRSRVYRIALATGEADIVHENDEFIQHVNTSPTQPNVLSFCHEGAPWRLKSRIWGLDLNDGRVWAIRPLVEAEGVNHEWWFPDGLHLGFMASRGPNYRDTSIGWIRWDNTEAVEKPSGVHCTHYHGNSTDLIVGDGTREQPYLFAWSLQNGVWRGPKVVCRHGTSFVCQAVHAHPRVSPDGSHIVYTSDATGYGNVYRVDLKPFDQLPDWPLPERKKTG